jgi:hypothetical protein
LEDGRDEKAHRLQAEELGELAARDRERQEDDCGESGAGSDYR